MAHVFIASAARITTTVLNHDDYETDVDAFVVSARNDLEQVLGDLRAWIEKEPPQPRTELRLTVTEVDPVLGHVIGYTEYQAVPSVTLERRR